MRSVFLLAMTGAGAAFAQNAPPPRTVLVELFTSEGCSSCPPADALLKRLNELHTAGGPAIVGISEHVTYWNQGGWADPFSAEVYTLRQSEYGRRFDLDSVYTPQMIVNGQQQAVGAKAQEILKDVNTDAVASPVQVEIEAAVVDGAKIQVTFTARGSVPERADVWAVVVDDVASSSVLKGENAGKTLQHVAVARAITKLGRAVGNKTVTASIQNPGSIKGQPATGRHVIVFVQGVGMGKVLAVESRGL